MRSNTKINSEIIHTQEKPVLETLDESQVLIKIGQMFARSLDLPKILSSIVEASTTMLEHVDQAVIHLYNKEANLLQPAAVARSDSESHQPTNMKPGEGVAGRVFESGQTINVADVLTDSRFAPASASQKPSYRSLLVAPISLGERALGTLSIQSSLPGVFSQNSDRLLTILGTQAAIAIERAQATQERLREVNFLFQTSQAMAQTLDTDTMLSEVSTLLCDFFGFYYFQVFLLDTTKNELILRFGSEPYGSRISSEGRRFGKDQGIAGHVIQTGLPFASNHVNEVAFYDPDPHLNQTQSILAVPLRAGDRILGVLEGHHRERLAFKDHDVQLMITISDQVSISLEKTKLYADLQAMLIQEQATRAQLVQSGKLAALGRIVASVAHELNNPLQAIQNALYLISLEDSLTTQVREDLQVALNEATRMADLIAQLRETYRPAGREEFVWYSLNRVIADVEKLLATHLRRNQVELETVLDPKLPECPMLQDQIKQVVLNICLNAVESMPRGGKLRIKTHKDHHRAQLSTNTPQVVMEISDTGSGIPPEVLPYIFDPFVTTKDRGTGLGLAITYDIVRRHGGNIHAESEVGKGTTFWVNFPIDISGHSPDAVF